MANPGKASGSVRERNGRLYIRVTIATGKREAVALPWCSSPDVALERARIVQGLVDRLRSAGHGELVAKVLDAAADPDAALLEAVGRAVDRLLAGELAPKAPKASGALTFQTFAERWTSGELHREFPDHVRSKRSADDDASRLKTHVYPEIGGRALDSLTLEDALAVLRKLPPELSSASRRHVAQLLSKVFAMAVYPCRLLTVSPLPRGFLPRIGKKKARSALYPDEEAKLLACAAVPLAHRLIYGYLAREGARTSEALALTWEDLDLVRGVVRLDANKTDEPRSWALDPSTAEALRRWKKIAGSSGPVFRPANPPQLAADLRAHLQEAGVMRPELFERSPARRPIRAHDLRATFVTVSLASGKPESFVTAKTGHKSSSEVNNYRRLAQTFADVGASELANMAETIPELSKDAIHGGPDGGPETGERLPRPAKHPIKPRKTAKGSAHMAFDSAYRGSNPRAGTGKGYGGLGPETSCEVDPLGPAMGPVMAGHKPQEASAAPVPEASDPVELVVLARALGPLDVGAPAEPPTTSADVLEHALALAISEAAKAGQWAIVSQLGRELEARRLAHLPNVVPFDAKRPSRR